MKKVLTRVLAALILLVAAITVAGSLMPTTYRIERVATINAAPAAIHAHVADLQKWPAWAPWEEEDPSIVTTYGEKTVGVGASQTWTSDQGNGELTLTKADPMTGIAYEMAFIMDGRRAPADCAMTYAEAGGSTTVTWTMEGDVADFMPRALAGLMTPLMDAQISDMFDRGLQSLKGRVESGE